MKQVNPDILGRQGNPTSTNSRVTVREFYAFHVQERIASSNCLLRMCRLFQEFLCVQCAKHENQKLFWLRTNQVKIRAELYNNICDAIHQTDALERQVRRSIILSPSFTGGPRDIHRRFQDGMAIIRHFHKPDLFITMTCNPKCAEITKALLEGQKAQDRPDIVARVFKLKLKAIIHDLCKNKICGNCVAYLYVVEFQKRGLPHAHILIIFDQDSRLRTTEDIDSIVCAELPQDPSSPSNRICKNKLLGCKILY